MNKDNQEQRHEHWQQLVEEQEKSSLSQKEFCKGRGLTLSQFVYYRCLFKNKNTTIEKSASFSPVKISRKENTSTPSEIKITLPNGFCCSFSSNIEVAQVKRLIEVLLSC